MMEPIPKAIDVQSSHAGQEGAAGEDGNDFAKRNLKRKQCGHCGVRGHVASHCISEIYCDICDVNHRCPILKLPKPVAHAGWVCGCRARFLSHPTSTFVQEERHEDGFDKGGWGKAQ